MGWTARAGGPTDSVGRIFGCGWVCVCVCALSCPFGLILASLVATPPRFDTLSTCLFSQIIHPQQVPLFPLFPSPSSPPFFCLYLYADAGTCMEETTLAPMGRRRDHQPSRFAPCMAIKVQRRPPPFFFLFFLLFFFRVFFCRIMAARKTGGSLVMHFGEDTSHEIRGLLLLPLLLPLLIMTIMG